MRKDMNSETLFCEYYRQWVDILGNCETSSKS